jgi:hypothetical protein
MAISIISEIMLTTISYILIQKLELILFEGVEFRVETMSKEQSILKI